jgi:hypothetical protein
VDRQPSAGVVAADGDQGRIVRGGRPVWVAAVAGAAAAAEVAGEPKRMQPAVFGG